MQSCTQHSKHYLPVVCMCVLNVHASHTNLPHTPWHTHYSMEVPVLWVRVDPDLQWICHLTLEQSDITWQSLLKYEREANAQLEAIEALEGYQTTTTRDALRDAVMNSSFYYHVRIQAAKSLAKVCMCV